MAPPRSIGASAEDERSLIQAAKRDPGRFGELYDAHFDRVYAYIAPRVRDRSEAEDITAEVFHRALRNLERFEWRDVPFSAWLFRIAANALRDRGKRSGRELPLDDDALAAGDLSADFERAERRARVFGLVKELPADQAEVVRMRFVSGRSIREIASELGRSEGAVKQLQYRALQTLRDRLRETDG